MPSKSSPENIILYPRSYNKRGDESLHSVQGVTADGEEVNVKLRVAAKYAPRDGTPSIAEFAREDYGAKNACIASPDNSPENRQGILLFSGCEPDGENRKGITSYIARWAYRLVADAESPSPVIGIGRIDVAEETSRNRGIRTDIEALQQAKPIGWEARVVRLEQDLNDATRFAYSLRVYQFSKTRLFPSQDAKAWEQWIAETVNRGAPTGTISGVLVRAKLSTGKYLPEIYAELIPIWNPRERRYQNGNEIVSWFHKQNPEISGLGEDVSLVVMPIDCHIAGQVFKKFYGDPKNHQKLRQQFYPNGEAELSYIAASQSLHDGSPLLLRVHALGNPLGTAMKLNEHGDFIAQVIGEAGEESGEILEKIAAGLNSRAPLFFPSWFEPTPVLIDESDLPLLLDFNADELQPEITEPPNTGTGDSFVFTSDPEMLDELVIVDDITEVVAQHEPDSTASSQDMDEPHYKAETDARYPESEPVTDVASVSFEMGSPSVDSAQPTSLEGLGKAVEDDFVNPFDEISPLALDEPDASWANLDAEDEPELLVDGTQSSSEESSGNYKPAVESQNPAPAEDAVTAPSQSLDKPSDEPTLVEDRVKGEGDAELSLDEDLIEPQIPASIEDLVASTEPNKLKPKGLAGFLAKRGRV
jgi:hypothetical protein